MNSINLVLVSGLLAIDTKDLGIEYTTYLSEQGNPLEPKVLVQYVNGYRCVFTLDSSNAELASVLQGCIDKGIIANHVMSVHLPDGRVINISI